MMRYARLSWNARIELRFEVADDAIRADQLECADRGLASRMPFRRSRGGCRDTLLSFPPIARQRAYELVRLGRMSVVGSPRRTLSNLRRLQTLFAQRIEKRAPGSIDRRGVAQILGIEPLEDRKSTRL